jgi:S-adenosylmethionine hydrolase
MQETERPVIGFLTDFGLDGAAATCRGVMLSICRDAQIVDICHTIHKYAIRDGAFVLAAALPYLPVGHHVAVVDPGVGTARRAVALRAMRGDILVGPDNGLLLPAAEALGGATEARLIENRDLWLADTSSTFHGRDIFAPVTARLAAGAALLDDVGSSLSLDDLVAAEAPTPRVDRDRIETEIVYVDSFGNIRLAGGRAELEAAFGALATGAAVHVRIGERASFEATFAASFGHVSRGSTLLYVDSSGHLALAENQGDLAGRLGSEPGMAVVIERS